MCLNTLAGRSYNDLMQYPVFPWIVADYKSEVRRRLTVSVDCTVTWWFESVAMQRVVMLRVYAWFRSWI